MECRYILCASWVFLGKNIPKIIGYVLDLTAFLFKTHQYIYYLKVLNMYDI